jgi:DNA repair protein RadC
MMKELNKVSEVEVAYSPNFNVSERPIINHSKTAYSILAEHWNFDKIELLEEFKILLLNRNNRVLGIAEISNGGTSGTVVDPKVIFAIAIKGLAHKLILCHNHPSGNLEPSELDKKVTKQLIEGGLLLDILVIEHIIITRNTYYSFADNGLC